jgi:hypothetical protein
VFIDFDQVTANTYNVQGDFFGYKYKIGTVSANYDIADEKTYKKLKTQLFITG